MSRTTKPGFQARAAAPVSTLDQIVDARSAMIRRLHRAMLTLNVQPSAIRKASLTYWPTYLHDFADKVEQLVDDRTPIVRFKPTGADIDDMLPALKLLEGVRPELFSIVRTFAWFDHHIGRVRWDDIADRHNVRSATARDWYERAMSHAALQAGLRHAKETPAAVVVIGVVARGELMSAVAAPPQPRPWIGDMRAKGACEIQDEMLVWAPSRAAATWTLVDFQAAHAERRDHGSWYRLSPLTVEEELTAIMRARGVEPRVEYGRTSILAAAA